ncbi:MAG TPA: signal recognition particle protein, partial [Ruania sp.]|nr:signal recognition particle protein [Ruania sp.]
KKLGPMKKMLEMLPGMGQMREQLENFDESDVTRIEAMVQSMTPAERSNPKIINGSRRSRIARGSGTTVSEINGLLERFEQAKTMMRSMSQNGGRGMPGMGGMPGAGGLPGGGKKSKGRMAPPKKKKRGKSGNPAKRAQQEREAAERAAQGPKAPSGAAFGAGKEGSDEVDPASLNLPAGFEKFLGR